MKEYVLGHMKAAVYYETGAPDVFRYEDVPDPIGRRRRPPDRRRGDQHRGRRHAEPAGRRSGPDAPRRRLPVRRHGGRGRRRRPRLRGGRPGGHGRPRRLARGAPGDAGGFAWKIPDGISTDDAACVPVPFGTADDCLFEFGRLQAGETALIHAGAGGVGIAAIQMAKRAGARVFATASSDDRLERLKELGLDEGINYATHDFVAEARRLTDGRGVDVIVDSVGGRTLQGSLNALAYRGRCVTVGDAGRTAAEQLDISTMRANNQTLSGYFLGAELLLSPRPHAMIAATSTPSAGAS